MKVFIHVSLVAFALFANSVAHGDTIAWNVAGGGNWDTTTTNWTGDGGGRNDNLFVDGDHVTFGNTAGGTINLTANRAPGSTTVSTTSGTYTFTGSAITSGNLTKSGGVTLVLNSAYTNAAGTINVTAGTLRLGGSNLISDSAVLTGSGSATLDMNGFDETLTWGSSSTPAIINMGNLTVKGLFQHDHSGGALSGAGSLTIDTGGLAGYVILGSTNTYTGGTFVNSGGLYLYSGGTLNPTGALHVASGAQFSLTWHNVAVDKTFGAISGGGTIMTNQALSQASILRVGNGGGSSTFSGNYTGPGSLVKMGGGTLDLTGTNTYTGTTTVEAGTLLINGTTGVNQGDYIVQAGATLGGGGIINLGGGNDVTIQSGGILAPGNSAGTLTINGGLTLNDGAVLNLELGTTGDKVVVNGVLTGSASAGGITVNVLELPGYGADYVLLDWSGGSATGLELSDFNLVPFGSVAGNLSIVGSQLLFIAHVPEPSSACLVALGMLVLSRRRRLNAAAA